MAWLKRTRAGWERAKQHAHNARTLPVRRSLSDWASSDQMVYALNRAYLEIGQGGNSPMRGWGAICFVLWLGLVPAILYRMTILVIDMVRLNQANIFDVVLGFGVGVIMLATMCFSLFYVAITFFSVTDATVRLDPTRKKVWLWTGKGPIEIDWHKLTPQVESSVATAYATVKTYRGQYAELGPNGLPLTTHGIPHVFQCGPISAAEEGVLPSMEYVRRYMEMGPHAVEPPTKLLSHKVRWYALVNLFGMADDWVRWKENRERPGVAPAPWIRTIIFIVFFPVFFPMQFTNWLALAFAPKPKWPRELEATHQADLATHEEEETKRRFGNSTNTQERDQYRPRRKPVIRVNGELLSDENSSSRT